MSIIYGPHVWNHVMTRSQIVQLVEHCPGVTKDNVRIPVQAFLVSANVGPKELRGSYIHFNPQFRYTEQYSKCLFVCLFFVYAGAK